MRLLPPHISSRLPADNRLLLWVAALILVYPPFPHLLPLLASLGLLGSICIALGWLVHVRRATRTTKRQPQRYLVPSLVHYDNSLKRIGRNREPSGRNSTELLEPSLRIAPPHGPQGPFGNLTNIIQANEDAQSPLAENLSTLANQLVREELSHPLLSRFSSALPPGIWSAAHAEQRLSENIFNPLINDLANLLAAWMEEQRQMHIEQHFWVLILTIIRQHVKKYKRLRREVLREYSHKLSSKSPASA